MSGHRFSYVKYTESSAEKQQILKQKFEEVEKWVEETLHDGRWKSLCLTNLEYAYMCTGKAIRDQQILEEGFSGEQTERGEE